MPVVSPGAGWFNRRQAEMAIYELGGRLYEALNLGVTLGMEERFKRDAIGRLGIEPGESVLDWGCGTGLAMPFIAEALSGRGHIIGLDASAPMMKVAVGRARPTADLTYSFVLRQGVGLDLPEPVDAVIASYALGVIDPADLDEALCAIWRGLRPGGRLLLIDMYVPEASNPISRGAMAVVKAASRRLFRQDLSGRLLPTVGRYFETVWEDRRPGLMAYALSGLRRDTPLDD